MSVPHTQELAEKARALGHVLGKQTSLASDLRTSAERYAEFRGMAERVHNRYKQLAREVSRQKHLTYEIESIFDNFFVVESAIFDIRNNLRKDDFKKLPLVSVDGKGSETRLHHILSRLLKESDCLIDRDSVTAFLLTYQHYSPLSIRELYAIPGILSIVLVTEFGQLIDKAIASLEEYRKAREIADWIRQTVSKDSNAFPKIIADLAEAYSIVPLSLGFHLFQRLSAEPSAMRPILKWLKFNFERQGINVKELSDLESRQRGANAAVASNIIESLHWLTQARWEQIVEEINVVDGILSKDPAGAYARMDLESKNRYRQVIVKVAEEASIHEAEVARTAVRLAQQAPAGSVAESHVGFYLIDKGRPFLERRINRRPARGDRLRRVVTEHASKWYFGTAAALDILLTAGLVSIFSIFESSPTFLWTAGILGLFLNLEVVLSLLNVLASRFLPVRTLPSLDLSTGIADDQRTFVVVPTMLRSADSIAETAHKLEIRYLGNRKDNVFYALLLDFTDADKENLPEDAALVEAARAEIDRLNARYPSPVKIFHFLYRRRLWNASEEKYMAWERKRGKLREFNMLLRGAVDTTYVNGADVSGLPRVRYVITLDEDTELPQNAAERLIGCIDHPLNRPVFGDRGNRLSRGYGIVQPRTSVKIAVAAQSLYSRLYSSGWGIDSYSTAVSDLYQDLFGNALFFGKGIYDIDAVERTMEGQIPDNAVLSHDLLEGIYARTGYASNVVLFDGFPRFYHEFAIRLQRWIRGDWQIIPWLWNRRRPFSWVDRFKIADNLRRSLVPVAAFAWVMLGLVYPSAAIALAVATVTVLAAPPVWSFLNDVLSIKRIPWTIRFSDTMRQAAISISHGALRICFLLHQAYISINAVTVTLFRMYVSKKRLLEWRNSTDIGRRLVGRLWEFYRAMHIGVLIPMAYGAYATLSGRVGPEIYFFLAWLFSPLLAFVISRPYADRPEVSRGDRRMLRAVAYRTAQYFLDLSRPENNWLIQDHYQEHPKAPETDRLTTSPTNLGMLFMSLFSSYDMGFIAMDRFLDRSRKALISLSKLPRHKGHLYNWYDIETLESLAPAYLSSVDSANFIMAMIAYRKGVEEIPYRPIIGDSSVRGLEDALYAVVVEAGVEERNAEKQARPVARDLRASAEEALERVSRFPSLKSLPDFYRLFTQVHPLVIVLEKLAEKLRDSQTARNPDRLFFAIEHLTKLVEEELAFQRYLEPHVHSRDASVDTHVSRDAKLSLAYGKILSAIERVPSLDDLSGPLFDRVRQSGFREAVEESALLPQAKEYVLAWYESTEKSVLLAQTRAREFLADIVVIRKECDGFIDEPDFGFLYNKERGLFHIGYNVTYGRLDSACYNLLASEANAVSFMAIYKNQVSQKHWFYLGRRLVRAGNTIGLVSWGGSLFEYLTPLIYFKAHPESLLGNAARSAIAVHRRQARFRRVPWGMGESAYYLFDSGGHYQYQVFGSPKVGLKRGLAEYRVIAPYVSALALSSVPSAAAANMRSMIDLGAFGRFGFYDALDYMDEKRIRQRMPLPVKIYYAHHQGFTMMGIHNLLDPDRIRDLFYADRRVASLDTLFEEKMPAAPAATTLSVPAHLPFTATQGISDTGADNKRYVPVRTPYPNFALLGNGSYTAAVSNAGSGFSRYGQVALTRFRDDPLEEEHGSFIYVKNERTGTIWSPTVRPISGEARRHKVVFHENKAEFTAIAGPVRSKLEVTVDPVLPAEIRILTLENAGEETERFSVASYGEVSLSTPAQEAHHPLYHRLLVSNEFMESHNALVFSRPHPVDRSRRIYFAHMLSRESIGEPAASFCADRESALGRWGSIREPLVFGKPKSKQARRFNLDPVFSLSRKAELKPGEKARFAFVSASHENKEKLLAILKKFRRGSSATRVMARSLSESVEVTERLGVTQDMALAFQSLASRVLGGKHVGDAGRAPASALPYVHSLWKLGISGDNPIAVVVIDDIEDIQTVKHALLCHNYWKHKGLGIDLIILNREPVSYVKLLDDEIDFLLRQSGGAQADLSGGRVHHVKSDLTEESDREVLLHVARVVLESKNGTFIQQIRSALRFPKSEAYPPKHLPAARPAGLGRPARAGRHSRPAGLQFENGWGGFDANTSEYVMTIDAESPTPAPWSNVIATPEMGTLVTESGAMYTWSVDSYDNRLSAWNTESLTWRSSEAFYIRDEETGEFWSPTPLPVRSRQSYEVRHGKGYTRFEHERGGLFFGFEVSVAFRQQAKFAVLSIRNDGGRKRSLSETVFLEPTMNVLRDHARDFISFERDGGTGALFFRQMFRNQLPGRVAFVDLSRGSFSVTTDKAEFLGRHGSYDAPVALKRSGLSNRLTSGTMNCAALQTVFSVEPGEEKKIVFALGEAPDAAAARSAIVACRTPDAPEGARLDAALKFSELFGSIGIRTPDERLDALFNHQLLHQARAGRIWGKTGFYQPSGAFGFRDQLQDMTAFLWSRPDDVKAFILTAAAHQFKEGDALNWWHPHNDFGAQSVLSDHQLWLVFAVLEYAAVTGDEKILDEEVPFLEGPILNFAHQREWAGTPRKSAERASLYEHCVRALAKSSVFGAHGLPLMGQSDWNDGLSRVGVQGRGESVWVAWFLGYLLGRFKSLAEKRGDVSRAAEYASRASALAEAAEKHAWDGRWYRRAFLDSGLAIGSRKLGEFKIDSVAQSWAVLSDMARPDRREKAMHSALSELFDGSVMKLLAPALEQSAFDPGYIRDYPPGVRENGAQYNHAALWASQALFKIGEADSAKKILDAVNPFARSDTKEKAEIYRVEPYVVASDVYADPSYKGRGGWTWYTGSAGVMYRTVVEYLFGFKVRGDTLSFEPSLPSEWTECSITYRRGAAEYAVTYEKAAGEKSVVKEVYLDGVAVSDNKVKMSDDAGKHAIRVVCG